MGPCPMSIPTGDTRNTARCDRCQAVCCRLTVVLQPGDRIESHLHGPNAEGVDVMTKGADGWCLALDRKRMRCSIYDHRPDDCRRFVMGASYCQAVREDWQRMPDPRPEAA